jgi:hypothetical protein
MNLVAKLFFFRFIPYYAGITGFLIGAVSALATTAIERTFPELVQRAEVIAVGTITDIREEWDETKKSPYTFVTLSSLTVLKGEAGDTITLRFFGGHSPEGKSHTIAGMPHVTLGETIVVFCAGNYRDVIPLVGLWQGLLRVAFDRQLGTDTVRNHAGIPIVGIEDGKFLLRTSETAARALDTPQAQPLFLSTLLKQIQWELESSRGNP